MQYACCIATPAGPLTVVTDERAVTRVKFGRQLPEGAATVDGAEQPEVLRRTVRELAEYFAGTRRVFTVAVAPAGTPFQQEVWAALQRIPWGERRSYGQLARAIGRPAACRAVGMANHRNPIAILIPCHRVVGADGSLTGYAGGLAIKAQLLALERPADAPTLF